VVHVSIGLQSVSPYKHDTSKSGLFEEMDDQYP
jgi:hypothetical protein